MLTAHAAQQRFRRSVVVHAVADQTLTLPPVAGQATEEFWAGEPLCGAPELLEACEPGLFAAPVTCRSCLAVIEQCRVEVRS